VGFILFWYDNLLVVAANSFVRDRLVQKMKAVSKSVNAQWKVEKQSGIINHGDWVTLEANTADYIGIRFRRGAADLVHWQHIKKQHWSLLVNEPINGLLQNRTWRAASQYLGIIVWDWTVKGAGRSSIQKQLDIAQVIGKQVTRQEMWDEPADLTPSQWKTLEVAVDAINLQGEQTRIFLQSHDGITRRKILVASDAMKDNGAAIIMSESGTEMAVMRHAYDEQLHINWKETDIARRAVCWICSKYQNCEIRLAVDNTTACVGLSRIIFVSDPQLQRDLDDMTSDMKEQNNTLLIVQVPGVVMAADERSRGQSSDVRKMKICVDFLLQARDSHWFTNLKKNIFSRDR
jgi:hypothetical protein